MAADAQMMSHFYSPLHHMYHSMHSSPLHPHSRYPAPGMETKYPGNGYPEQKYDPGQAHQGDSSPGLTTQPPTLTPGPGKVGQSSPGSSPHQPPVSSMEAGAGYHGGHAEAGVDRAYLTPPPGHPGHVTPEMRDIKPVPGHHDSGMAGPGANMAASEDKDLSESSIEGPEVSGRGDEKSEYSVAGGHLGAGHDTGCHGHGGGGSGYYNHSDLSHPSYGGYSTAGPFPLSSPLARPRSNKNKSNSGKMTADTDIRAEKCKMRSQSCCTQNKVMLSRDEVEEWE